MKKNLLTLVFLLLILQTGISQTFDKTNLDNYFQALEKNNKFMGSVAVSQNGKIIYTKQLGYADVDNKIKPNYNTKYKIGSI